MVDALRQFSRRFIVSFALFSAVAFAGCARNFVTRHREVHLVSEKTEVEIGRKAKEEIIKEYGSYHDLDWQIYLDQIGQRVAKASDRPGLAYDFTILDTDLLNAFAVPGGFVFVTRGILVQMADEAELAVVLGHEITHVAAWHAVKQLERAGALQTLMTIGAIGGIALGAPEAAIAISQAAGVYANLYLLGYGRKYELEADRYGIYYAARAGYDPGAALTFFDRLDKIEKEEDEAQHISPYWRSHPPTRDRLQLANRWITQISQTNNASNYNRDRYQAMVAKLPRGEPSEKGTVQGTTYRNPQFGVFLDVPKGWKLDNSRLQSMVGFVGPIPEVRGTLQRYPLHGAMGVQEFGNEVKKQWGVDNPVSRDVDYPAGHGLIWQYGSDYTRYRTLLLVRGETGYVLLCQVPADQYLQYLVDCERIMRSLQIQ